jgi:hypothetical protein
VYTVTLTPVTLASGSCNTKAFFEPSSFNMCIWKILIITCDNPDQ